LQLEARAHEYIEDFEDEPFVAHLARVIDTAAANVHTRTGRAPRPCRTRRRRPPAAADVLNDQLTTNSGARAAKRSCR
jgi:hypothetical protein